MRPAAAIMRFGLVLCLLLAPGLAAAACDPAAVIEGAGERYLLLAEGDSITFGQQSTDGLGSYVQRACFPKVNRMETIDTAVSRAVLGSPTDAPGANSLYGRMRSDNALLARKGDRIAILSVLIGRNDLVGYGGGNDSYADALAAYVGAMRRAGWDRIIVGTELPSTWEPFNPQRNDLNSILTMPGWAAAHGIDVIADFAASPQMGPDDAAGDTRLYADGIHPNNHGYELLAPIYGAAIRKIVSRHR